MSLLLHGLLYGLLLSAGLCLLFLGAARWNPEIMMRGYPPDIKLAYGPLRPDTHRQRWLLMIPMTLWIVGVLAAALSQLPNITGQPLTFWQVFFTSLIVLLTFNLIDLLVLDWLIFVKLQPKFVILPGTAGAAGYRDYGFHFHGFLKGTFGIVIFSLLFAVGWRLLAG
jgi:hypothetical protein